MSVTETGLSPSRLRAVNVLAGAESDGTDVPGCESEAVAEWSRELGSVNERFKQTTSQVTWNSDHVHPPHLAHLP